MANSTVRWADGALFKQDPLSHPAVVADSANSGCFLYDKQERINDYSCPETFPFLCQYTCTGENEYNEPISPKFSNNP